MRLTFWNRYSLEKRVDIAVLDKVNKKKNVITVEPEMGQVNDACTCEVQMTPSVTPDEQTTDVTCDKQKTFLTTDLTQSSGQQETGQIGCPNWFYIARYP